jgi:hypothetical protein
MTTIVKKLSFGVVGSACEAPMLKDQETSKLQITNPKFQTPPVRDV